MGNNLGKTIFGPDGQPLSSQPPIVVIKSRHPLGPEIVKQVGMATKSSVIVLPLAIDLIMGNLAMEEIEAIHFSIHNILGIEEEEVKSSRKGGEK